jgi:hypothetical protein
MNNPTTLLRITAAGLTAAALTVGGFAITAAADSPTGQGSAQAKAASTGKHRDHRGARGVYLAAAARALGVTPAELRADLKQGMTLHQVADQKGVTEAQFRASLYEQAKPELDKAVADGKITKAQEDKMLDRIKTGPLPLWDKLPHKRSQ